MRVAIVGGGVMGCATALELTKRGAHVVLLERAIPGAEASSAAAGILGAQMESHGPGPLVDMFVKARSGYRAWSEELRGATGIDIGYRASGVMRAEYTEKEAQSLQDLVAWQKTAGLRADLLDPKRARRNRARALGRNLSAAYFPDDAQGRSARTLACAGRGDRPRQGRHSIRRHGRTRHHAKWKLQRRGGERRERNERNSRGRGGARCRQLVVARARRQRNVRRGSPRTRTNRAPRRTPSAPSHHRDRRRRLRRAAR